MQDVTQRCRCCCELGRIHLVLNVGIKKNPGRRHYDLQRRVPEAGAQEEIVDGMQRVAARQEQRLELLAQQQEWKLARKQRTNVGNSMTTAVSEVRSQLEQCMIGGVACLWGRDGFDNVASYCLGEKSEKDNRDTCIESSFHRCVCGDGEPNDHWRSFLYQY